MKGVSVWAVERGDMGWTLIQEFPKRLIHGDRKGGREE